MTIVIHRVSEKIPVKVGPVTFYVTPYTHSQKTDILGHVSNQSGKRIQDNSKMAALAIKYCLKGIDGVRYSDGTIYELSFGDDGYLTDDCISEIGQLGSNGKLTGVLAHFLNEITDPGIEGVTVDLGPALPSKKKQ